MEENQDLSRMPAADTANSRVHFHYFDPIRLIAAFSVVFSHVASGLLRGTTDFQWELLNVCTCFAFTSIPLFLMMSGYLLLSGKKTGDISDLLTRRVPRLLVPLCFWSAIAVLKDQLFQHTFTPLAYLDGLVSCFQSPAAVHLWYMYLILALYLISPVLHASMRGLNADGHRYVLALIAAVTVQAMLIQLLPTELDRYVSFNLFEYLKIFSGHLCTFLLGYYLGRTERTFPNWLLGGAAVLLFTAITLGTRVLTLRTGVYTADFLTHSAGFEVALAACLFLLWKQNFTRPIPRPLSPAVALSLPIYLMHNILLSVFEHYGLFPHDFLETVGISALIFLICFLCMKTAASVRPFCFLVTGMTYRAACLSCNWQYTFHALQSKLSSQPTNSKGEH